MPAWATMDMHLAFNIVEIGVGSNGVGTGAVAVVGLGVGSSTKANDGHGCW